jgi:hypothetical protein
MKKRHDGEVLPDAIFPFTLYCVGLRMDKADFRNRHAATAHALRLAREHSREIQVRCGRDVIVTVNATGIVPRVRAPSQSVE